MSTVIEVVSRIHKVGRGGPIVSFFSPLSVRVILRIRGQSCTEIEKDAIRDGVLIVVAVVKGKNLPPQPSIAGVGIPPQRLRVEDGLGKGQPLRLFGWWIGEILFRRRHRGHAPEPLIIVAFGLGLIGRHVVGIGADLVEHALGHHIIVRTVIGVVIVVNQGSKHGTRLPPIVGLWQIARHVAGVVPRVEFHHIVCDITGGGFDRRYHDFRRRQHVCRSRSFHHPICGCYAACNEDIPGSSTLKSMP